MSHNGSPPMFGVSILCFRGERIARESIYVMDGFEPSPSRSEWASPFDRLASIAPDDWRDGVPFGIDFDEPAGPRGGRASRGTSKASGCSLQPPCPPGDPRRATRTAWRRDVFSEYPVFPILLSSSASTDPSDPFFVAIERLGGRVVRHGVPAHPGSMLWLARVGAADILGLPTCGAYSKATAADLLLPRLLSGERASAATVARLGVGGILTRSMRFRFPRYARELDAPEG